MWIAHTVSDCRRQRAKLLGPVAFVPTMGALHAGHISLVHHGRQIAPHTLVSIFVNPTQFGPHEDLSRYPRPLENDLELCRHAGVTGVFIPSVDEMYPSGARGGVGDAPESMTNSKPPRGIEDLAPATPPSLIDIPALTADLEGPIRPGHFQGVCRVVAKLFNITTPDFAIFGKKDYQQWRVIQAMTRDLFLPIEIIALPTVREPDGLAMSSRNVFLSPVERPRAIALYQALNLARQLIDARTHDSPHPIEQAMRDHLTHHGLQIDYATLRDAHSLAPIPSIEKPQARLIVALIAARLGSVRLLDNLEIPPAP